MLCQSLDSGLESPDLLFRTFLFGDGFGSWMASMDSLGAAGEVYKRAAALRMASLVDGTDQGRALASFMCDRMGVQSARDVEAFAGADFDLATAAFSGAGELAIEYLCKLKLFQGAAIPEDVTVRLSELPVVRQRVDAFCDRLRKVRGYVASVDESAQAYAQSLGGDFLTQISLASAIGSGQWDDEFLAARAGTDYLGWRQELVDSSLGNAAQVITAELGQKYADLAALARQRFAEEAYWKQVGNTASQTDSWRSYLVETNIGASCAVGSAYTPQTRDVQEFLRDATSPEGNFVLEAFNGIVGQENAFAAQLAADPGDTGALSGFHSFLDAYVAGTVSENDLPAPAEQGLVIAEGNYQAALARVEGLKGEIRSYGDSLALLDKGSADRANALSAMRLAMEAAGGLVISRRAAADAAFGTFERSVDSYNGLSIRLQNSVQQLQQARFALRTQEEIQDWASNGYLSSSGDETGDYQSPVHAQSEAAAKVIRATAALDALRELFGGSTVTERPIQDAPTLAAYQSWKTSYSQLLRLDSVVGELEEASSEQAKKVDELYAVLQRARSSILKWEEADGSLGDVWSNDPVAGAKNWASYISLKDGQLSMNISDGFVLHTQGTEAEWRTVKDFFEKRETQPGDLPGSVERSSFERAMETWLVTVDALSGSVGGMNALIDRWGFAADWLRRRLCDSNGSSALVSLSGYSSDDMFIAGDYLTGPRIGDFNVADSARSCMSQAVALAQRSYQAVMSDPAERQAFGFYFAIRMAVWVTGQTSPWTISTREHRKVRSAFSPTPSGTRQTNTGATARAFGLFWTLSITTTRTRMTCTG